MLDYIKHRRSGAEIKWYAVANFYTIDRPVFSKTDDLNIADIHIFVIAIDRVGTHYAIL